MSKGKAVYAFGFRPYEGITDFCWQILMAQIILNTDDIKYAGQGSLKEDQYYKKTISRR